MHRLHRRNVGSGILLMTVVAVGCDPTGPGPGIEPDSSFAASCAEDGPTHAGVVAGSWGPYDGPHHVTGDVTVSLGDGLVIEAGARVCVAAGAVIESSGGPIRVLGTEDAPIVVTAEDSTAPWGGFRSGIGDPITGGLVQLAFTRVEHAERAVVAPETHLEDVEIRRVQGEAVRVSSNPGTHDSVLRRVVIEDACLSEGQAAVHQGYFSNLTLEDVVIRDAGCGGIYSQENDLTLRNVLIEGAAGIGFQQSTSRRGGGPRLRAVEGLRITGGGDIPLSVRGDAASRILEATPVDSLTGNAIDRVRIFGWIPSGLHATRELGLELSPGTVLDYELVLEPGSHLRVHPDVAIAAGFRLIAEGTGAAPIRIDGPPGGRSALRIAGERADTSRLAHVVLDGVRLRSTENHTLIASDVTVTRSWLWLGSPGSSITHATIEDAAAAVMDPSFAALWISAPNVAAEDVTIRGSSGHGLLITGSNASVDGCEITGSAGDAIWVANQATGVSVHDCNLPGNQGVGLRSTAPGTVDARFNWWGDPAGPAAPDGARASGAVDTDPWLPAPAGDSTLAISCDQRGPEHSGAVGGRWGAYGGPHHVLADVTVSDTLVVEAGALVCGAEGAAIRTDRGATLLARGTAGAPVVFTAADSTRPWRGLVMDDANPYWGSAISLTHARVEHAAVGLDGGTMELESSVVRATSGPAVRIRSDATYATATLRNTLIDSACREGGEAAVHQLELTDAVLEHVVIRDSGCRGIYAAYKASHSLVDVRIEGSAGVGLEHGGVTVRVDRVEGLRITGGADRPARVSGETALAILDAVPAASLAGNAIDRLAVFAWVDGTLRGTAALGLELGHPDSDVDPAGLLGDVVLEPGSHLRINHATFYEGFRLLAEGTADAPIRIDASDARGTTLLFRGAAGDTSRLAHAVLDGIDIRSMEAHTLLASDVTSARGSFWLGSPGSALRNATIEDADPDPLGSSSAALFASAQGVIMENVALRGSTGHGLLITGSDASVEGCEITGSTGDAIWVANAATGVSVHNCSLTGNGGLGLRNTVDATVDAEMNWWGDPTGPLGPDGAGVSGNVDFDPWLTEPPT